VGPGHQGAQEQARHWYLSNIAIIQGFKGKSQELPPNAIFSKFFENYVANLGNWAHTLKVFIILHLGMQEPTLMKTITDELIPRKEMLYSYAKKMDDTSYDAIKHMEISKQYLQYLRSYIALISEGSFMKIKDKDITEYVRSCSTKNLFFLYENMELSIISITHIFMEALFCSKFRIYKCLYQMLYKETEKMNRSLILILNELTKRVDTSNIEWSKKACMCYANYIEVTRELKEKIYIMLPAMKFTMINIKYFEGDDAKVQMLRHAVTSKIEKSQIPLGKDDASSGSEYSVEEDEIFKENIDSNAKAAKSSKKTAQQDGAPNIMAHDLPTQFDDLFSDPSGTNKPVQ
jgi:hypothetical protein